eukprot:327862_1
MPEFLVKKRMNGLSLKTIETIVFAYCCYCMTFVCDIGPGDWRTGKPIDFDICKVHRKNPDDFITFKKSWTNHEASDLHHDNYYALHSPQSDYKHSNKYKQEIKILIELLRTVLEMKLSRIANIQYPRMLARKYKQGVAIGNQPHSKFYVADMVGTMAKICVKEISADVSTVLDSTKHPPSCHMTADKGEGLHKKIQLGHMIYWSSIEKDFVSKKIICNELTYKDGEKSGSAKEVALSLNKPLKLVSMEPQQVKSLSFDNQYYDNGTVKEIEINWKKESDMMWMAYRDTCHNINLIWGRVYGDCLYAQTVLKNVNSIINPLNHGSIISLKAKNIMAQAAVSTPALSITKWIQKQELSMSNLLWMLPAIAKVYRNYISGHEDMKQNNDYLVIDIENEREKYLNKTKKKYVNQLESIECIGNVSGMTLLCDIGLPYKTITTKNETHRHEPWEILKEKLEMHERTLFEKEKVLNLIDNYKKVFIPEELEKFYPLTSSLKIVGDTIKMKIDMNKLNRRCPSLKYSKRPHKCDEKEWKQYVEKREEERSKIIEMVETMHFGMSICILPMNEYCESCQTGKFLNDLLSCYGCGKNSHLQCNEIQNRSSRYYSGNKINFICKLNGCDQLLQVMSNENDNKESEILLQPTETPECKYDMNYTIQEIKALNKPEIERELANHHVFQPRFKTLKNQKQKLLIEHYQQKHFIKMLFKKPKIIKAKTEYKKMTLPEFLKFFHQQHYKLLNCIEEGIHMYWRYPELLEDARHCFDFREMRAALHIHIGQLFENCKSVKKQLNVLIALHNNLNTIEKMQIFQQKGGMQKIRGLKIMLKKFTSGVDTNEKINELINDGKIYFYKILQRMNSHHSTNIEEKIDIQNAGEQYDVLVRRIFELSITKQLARNWYQQSLDKGNNIFSSSNALTNLILGDPNVYYGCANAVYPYEIIVGGDASEPEVEQDFFMFNLQVRGRHRIYVNTFQDERILINECKKEYSPKVDRILKEAAELWREDHSSPIVTKSKYKVSPSVDKQLGLREQKQKSRLRLPYKLQLPFSASFLKKSEILSLKKGDEIDHRNIDGLYCRCRVIGTSKYTSVITLKYLGEWKCDAFEADLQDAYNYDKVFANKESISRRHNYGMPELQIGALLEVKYKGEWKSGRIVSKADKSGQYKFLIDEDSYWYHSDDVQNVRKFEQ